MAEQQNPSTDWTACQPGLITGHVQRLHRRRLLLLAAKTSGLSVCVAALGVGCWLTYLQRLETEYQYSGLTCSDIRELMPSYRTRRLDGKRSKLLEQHVRRCPNCERFRTELSVES